jgi:hypothetical protein
MGRPPGQDDSPDDDAAGSTGSSSLSVPEQGRMMEGTSGDLGLPVDGDTAAWNEFFSRYKERIVNAEKDQNVGLQKLDAVRRLSSAYI